MTEEAVRHRAGLSIIKTSAFYLGHDSQVCHTFPYGSAMPGAHTWSLSEWQIGARKHASENQMKLPEANVNTRWFRGEG